MLVSTSIIFLSANSTKYLVSTGDGTMPIKELNSTKVRFLLARFHALAIIMSFALTSCPSEVLLVRESHNLRDSNSLLEGEGDGFVMELLGAGEKDPV
ncbi:hypothetical protein Tco_0149144 [Tanacetum coccineum]